MHVVTGASLGQKRPPAPDDLGVNAVWVATAALMCCGCHESGENESQERERESLKLLMDYHTTILHGDFWRYRVVAGGGTRRITACNYIALCSQCYPAYASNPRRRCVCCAHYCSRSLSGTSLWTQITADRIII